MGHGVLDKKYHVFENDSYLKLMPQLIASGLHPLSTADLMRTALEAFNSKGHTKLKEFLSQGLIYHGTTDGLAYNGRKRKIVYDIPNVTIHADPKVDRFGFLMIGPNQYKRLEGEEISRDSLNKPNHPAWIALAKGDLHLWREFRDLVHINNLPHYPYGEFEIHSTEDYPPKEPAVVPLLVSHIRDHRNRNRAEFVRDLDGSESFHAIACRLLLNDSDFTGRVRFLGKESPREESSSKKPLEQRV